jgi:phosphoesterase RecJ-like protein
MIIDIVLREFIQAEHIAIITHIQPDGDAVGSCLALAEILKEIGKDADLFCQDRIPASLSFLAGTDQFKRETAGRMSYDLAIAVDCSDKERMGACAAVFDNAGNTINIDHHISNVFFANINLVDSNAAATGEIIYQLGKARLGKLSRQTAEALYTAISTDTGSFCFSSTTPQSYRIAAELMDCGIDIEHITNMLYKTNRVERMRLLGKALQSLELYENNQIAVLTITQDDLISTGAMESETENIVNYAKDIVGVKVGILLKETADGSVKASFRSNGGVDVGKLAAQFGGGGHRAASGASMQMSVPEAKSELLTAVQTALGEMIQ